MLYDWRLSMTCLTRRISAGLVIATLVASWAVKPRGQEQASGAAAFEVASINENRSGELDGVFRFANGRFRVTNQAVRWIIRWVDDLKDYQISGLPNWTETR